MIIQYIFEIFYQIVKLAFAQFILYIILLNYQGAMTATSYTKRNHKINGLYEKI